MKVFICADMEGITTTATHDEVNPSGGLYGPHAKQVTEEVLACIEGAKKAGATKIVVKDAHGPALNIDPARMPSGVTLLRGKSGHPYAMAEGIDGTFDAAMFVGHHSAASRPGSPMSHTISGSLNYIKLNGVIAGEFLIYSYACAFEGVPTVFLSGDKMLCDDYKDLHPKLVTCTVKDGIGGMSINYSPEDTMKNLRELSEKALRQDLSDALIRLPDFFEVEFCFKSHAQAQRASYYPGVAKANDSTVSFKSECYFEILRAVQWIVRSTR